MIMKNVKIAELNKNVESAVLNTKSLLCKRLFCNKNY